MKRNLSIHKLASSFYKIFSVLYVGAQCMMGTSTHNLGYCPRRRSLFPWRTSPLLLILHRIDWCTGKYHEVTCTICNRKSTNDECSAVKGVLSVYLQGFRRTQTKWRPQSCIEWRSKAKTCSPGLLSIQRKSIFQRRWAIPCRPIDVFLVSLLNERSDITSVEIMSCSSPGSPPNVAGIGHLVFISEQFQPCWVDSLAGTGDDFHYCTMTMNKISEGLCLNTCIKYRVHKNMKGLFVCTGLWKGCLRSFQRPNWQATQWALEEPEIKPRSECPSWNSTAWLHWTLITGSPLQISERSKHKAGPEIRIQQPDR